MRVAGGVAELKQSIESERAPGFGKLMVVDRPHPRCHFARHPYVRLLTYGSGVLACEVVVMTIRVGVRLRIRDLRLKQEGVERVDLPFELQAGLGVPCVRQLG